MKLMSVNSFARRLGDAGLWKAQKRSKTDKKVEVVWVGFKRKGAVLKPPSSPDDGESDRRKRPRLEGEDPDSLKMKMKSAN